MKNVIKLISCSVLAVLLSAQAFASLNFSVTGDSTLSAKVDSTKYSSQGVSLFADYQVMPAWPVALGLMGSFQNRTAGQAQSEVAPTMKFWLNSDVTGIAALQPYARVGYAFSWVDVGASKAHTNNGLVMNIGNSFSISETVSAVVAYTFNARTYNNGTTTQTASSHGASIGFSAELF